MWRCAECRDNASDLSGHTAVPELAAGSRSSSTPRVCPADVDAGNVREDAMGRLVEVVQSLREAVNFCSDKVTDFEKKLSGFSEMVSRIKKLEKDNESLRKEVSFLNSKLRVMEQQSRFSNIEVQNVPEKNKENLRNIMVKLVSHINADFNVAMIDKISRVQFKIKNRPKNIVVRYVSRINRDKFLSAYKAKQHDNGEHSGISVQGVADRIYINEHLTMENKILFKEVRSAAREKSYKYVWVQNGNIMLRKDDTSRKIHIHHDYDLSSL
ncbi:uncharacterized protein LOC123313997 [Coccinella septempunctata]|uniref:uncharacterized protein LOC123313997 n=1 Tax=Coccinella septempunctata TaxID=41139 RepID=UPI001D099DF5|nr:uncharacterized protein LOC123313997 [Coccinella septempunctata]